MIGGHTMNRNGRLKSAIFEAGIRQKELAEKVNIPRGYLSLVLTGRMNLTGEEQQRIAAVLKKHVNELF